MSKLYLVNVENLPKMSDQRLRPFTEQYCWGKRACLFHIYLQSLTTVIPCHLKMINPILNRPKLIENSAKMS